ncbi:MAG: alpha-hydroxy-acid oxidizing protein [Propionibacteriaceae bacterium]
MSAPDAASAPPSIGRRVQSALYRQGLYGHRPVVPTHPDELARRARESLSRRAWAYLHGSAGAEQTTAANRAALDGVRLVPRMLVDVARRDCGIDLFGHRLETPFLLSPIGVLGLCHREADLAVARACRESGVPMTVSTQASVPMEGIAAEFGHTPWFHQLYWSSNDDLVASMVHRAERAGATALVVTLDTHVLGWRTRDLDLGHLPFAHGLGIAQYTSDPVFRRLVEERAARPGPVESSPRPTPAAIRALVSMARHHPGAFLENLRSPLPRAAVETFLDVFSRSDLTWQDLARLRGMTSLPLLVKGIQHPDDAQRALAAGVDGIWVSNHGGRQVDGAIGALDALPMIMDRVRDQVPVIFDSGVRGGADALKALALGATAVGLGRPYAYGLAVAGESGVRQVIDNFRADLDLTLALCGLRTVAEASPDLIAPN